MVEEIGKLAGQYGAARIVIEGHTDGSMRGTVPKSAVQELSLNRANAVKEAIVRKFPSLQPNQFSAAGLGWDKPADAADPDNQAKNRRVEMKVYPGESQRPPSRWRARAGRRCSCFVSLRRRSSGGCLASAAIALVVLLWWLATAGAGPRNRLVSPVILPSPREVLASFPSLLNESALAQSVAATLQRVLIGFGLAVLVGVPLGIVAGSWRVVRRVSRAARLVRPQPSRRRADSSHYLVVRDRRRRRK